MDHDFKEAIDLRDTGGRDPSFHAAKALESTIKIVSSDRGWTTGNERGAGNYLDNLKRNEFIENWEKDIIQKFFSAVRNPLGHGAGGEEMPKLSSQQTDWAIEFCMVWIRSLIRRIQ